MIPLIILLVFATNVAAKAKKENDPEPSMDVRYGIRIGINNSSIYSYGNGFSSGLQIGGAADIPLKKIKIKRKWGLIDVQPEVMFVSKNSSRPAGEDGRPGYEINAYYLEVPYSGSFKFLFSQNFAVRIDAGPYFAVGLFGERETIFGEVDAFSDGGPERFDIGMHYGIAIEFFKNLYFAFANSSSKTSYYMDSVYATLGYNF